MMETYLNNYSYLGRALYLYLRLKFRFRFDWTRWDANLGATETEWMVMTLINAIQCEY